MNLNQVASRKTYFLNTITFVPKKDISELALIDLIALSNLKKNELYIRLPKLSIGQESGK